MRTTTVNRLAPALLALLLAAGPAPGQSGGDKSAKPADKKPSQLEELIAQALKDNPDVRVAEAKLREADAELTRARMVAVQKVVAAQHAIETATNGIKMAEARVAAAEAMLRAAEADYQRITKLGEAKSVARAEIDQARANVEKAKADYDVAKAALQTAKADLAIAEKQLPYLLGKDPVGDAKRADAAREFLKFAQPGEAGREQEAERRAAIEWLTAHQQPKGTVADKLRKALDKTVNLKVEEQPFGDVLKWVSDNASVSVVSTFPRELATKKVSANIQDVPLGAAFQLLEDLGGVQFGVREYGILVSDKLPSGVMRLHDFWKAPAEKPKSEKSEKPDGPKGAHLNPPPGNVEGKVVGVADGDLVEVSIGSDAGLAKGQTLEVYRHVKDKEYKYLGTVRLVEVKAGSVVGKVTGKRNAPIEKGDRVSNKLFVD